MLVGNQYNKALTRLFNSFFPSESSKHNAHLIFTVCGNLYLSYLKMSVATLGLRGCLSA
jgi:hypothetical protein